MWPFSLIESSRWRCQIHAWNSNKINRKILTYSCCLADKKASTLPRPSNNEPQLPQRTSMHSGLFAKIGTSTLPRPYSKQVASPFNIQRMSWSGARIHSIQVGLHYSYIQYSLVSISHTLNTGWCRLFFHSLQACLDYLSGVAGLLVVFLKQVTFHMKPFRTNAVCYIYLFLAIQ